MGKACEWKNSMMFKAVFKNFVVISVDVVVFKGVGSLLSDSNESLTLSTTVTTLLNPLLKMLLYCFIHHTKNKNTVEIRVLFGASLSGKPLHINTYNNNNIGRNRPRTKRIQFFFFFLVILKATLWGLLKEGVATKWDLKLKISRLYCVLCVCVFFCLCVILGSIFVFFCCISRTKLLLFVISFFLVLCFIEWGEWRLMAVNVVLLISFHSYRFNDI